jgi:hypothetical protein
MSLVRVSHVDRQPGQSVRACAASGRCAGLSQGQESLEPQRPLEGLRADAYQVEAAAPQLGGGDGQVLGEGADLDPVPRHQSSYRLSHQRIGMTRAPEGHQEMSLEETERCLRPGRGGHRLAESFGSAAPQLLEAHPLIHEIVEDRRERRRRPRVEPHSHECRMRGDDLDIRASQWADQLWPATDREVEFNTTGGQMPLNVRRPACALNPDGAHCTDQLGDGRTLDVGMGHACRLTASPFTGQRLDGVRAGHPPSYLAGAQLIGAIRNIIRPTIIKRSDAKQPA